MDDILTADTFTCPITRQIFQKPVLAGDNHLYEKTAIKQWFKKNNRSPLTNLKIAKELYSNATFDSLLKLFLEKHPEEKNNQFIKTYDHVNYVEKIENIIKTPSLFPELLFYGNFMINKFSSMVFIKNLSDNKQEEVIRHLIDNALNIEAVNCIRTKKKLIHYICQYSTPKMIKYIIDKGVNLECKDIEQMRPIHYICQYSTPEMIKYIIDKGVNLECKTGYGSKPIHYICQYSTPEMVKYIIDKGVDLEYQNYHCLKPIHYICQYSTPEMVKYIIDKGVNLECQTYHNFRPIHLICQYSTPEIIKYIIDKGVDLECIDNEQWKPIHYICRFSTPEIIKYIIDKGVDLECIDNEQWKPIHYICRFSTPEMIKYIIDKGAALECQDNQQWKPIDFICNHSTPEMIKYIIDEGWKLVHLIYRYLIPKIIKYDEKNIYCEIKELIILNNSLKKTDKDSLINYIEERTDTNDHGGGDFY